MFLGWGCLTAPKEYDRNKKIPQKQRNRLPHVMLVSRLNYRAANE